MEFLKTNAIKFLEKAEESFEKEEYGFTMIFSALFKIHYSQKVRRISKNPQSQVSFRINQRRELDEIL